MNPSNPLNPLNPLTVRTRFSVLDRSRIREGRPPGEALRDTVRLAREVEALGYHRFWVAEHHGVPGVAGSAPTVLAAAVAGATERIRVGTGGVMLPNHRPLVVAEQFGVLESLFPGRIDMGLGRSVGFTDGVRRALGRDKEDAEDFAAQIEELLGWFRGTSPTGVHARPAEGLGVPPFVLAMGEGADVAARLGLPLVIGDLRGRDRMRRGIDRYRDAFRPSPGRGSPTWSSPARSRSPPRPRRPGGCWSRRRGRWRTPARTARSRRCRRPRRSSGAR